MSKKVRATKEEMERIITFMLELQDINNGIMLRYDVGFEDETCIIHDIQSSIMMLQEIDDKDTEERYEIRKQAGKKAWATRRKDVV